MDANELGNGRRCMDHLNTLDIVDNKRDDSAAAAVKALKDRLKQKFGRNDDRYKDLLAPFKSWDHMVVKVLHMIRFCDWNIAFFDLDKECEFMLYIS